MNLGSIIQLANLKVMETAEQRDILASIMVEDWMKVASDIAKENGDRRKRYKQGKNFASNFNSISI